MIDYRYESFEISVIRGTTLLFCDVIGCATKLSRSKGWAEGFTVVRANEIMSCFTKNESTLSKSLLSIRCFDPSNKWYLHNLGVRVYTLSWALYLGSGTKVQGCTHTVFNNHFISSPLRRRSLDCSSRKKGHRWGWVVQPPSEFPPCLAGVGPQ
jgi:hypothetical protein